MCLMYECVVLYSYRGMHVPVNAFFVDALYDESCVYWGIDQIASLAAALK